MERKVTKKKDDKIGRESANPIKTTDVDKTESGPSRLYAPGKPREVESGPSRLQTSVSGSYQAGRKHPDAGVRPRTGIGLDTTEAGPARIGRYRK